MSDEEYIPGRGKGISEMTESEARGYMAWLARRDKRMQAVYEARKEALARTKAAAVAAGTDRYVWLVVTGDHDTDDYELHGIFSTESLAEAFAVGDRATERYSSIDQYRIERWFLDCGAWQYEDAKMWPTTSNGDGKTSMD